MQMLKLFKFWSGCWTIGIDDVNSVVFVNIARQPNPRSPPSGTEKHWTEADGGADADVWQQWAFISGTHQLFLKALLVALRQPSLSWALRSSSPQQRQRTSGFH